MPPSLQLSMLQRHVGLQDDALVVVAGGDLHVEGLCTGVRQLPGDDDLRAVEVVGEKVLGDVSDRALCVVDPYVGQQRGSYFIVEPGEEHKDGLGGIVND